MVSPFLCRLLNSEETMESGLNMTKPFLVFSLLVIVGLLYGLRTDLKQTMKITIEVSNTLDTMETQVENLLAMAKRLEPKSSK